MLWTMLWTMRVHTMWRKPGRTNDTQHFGRVPEQGPFRAAVAQPSVTTSLSTGGGPVSYVQLSEGGFQVVYPLGLWSRFSGVVKVLHGYGL